MRTVFVGASSLAVATAQHLLHRGHDVIVIDRDAARIDSLKDELACAFLHADGSRPAVLKETDPADTDFLFCLTGNDQTNILASLVGRSLGFGRVITKIDDAEYEHICVELGLGDLIVPARTIGRHLAEIVEGQDPLEVSAMIKGEARVFSFVIHADDAGALSDLALPADSRVICVYRGDDFILPAEDLRLRADDQVLVITHSRNLKELSARWQANAMPGP